MHKNDQEKCRKAKEIMDRALKEITDLGVSVRRDYIEGDGKTTYCGLNFGGEGEISFVPWIAEGAVAA